MNEHIVIITGADALPAHVVERIPDEAIVLAVDGGLDAALGAGLRPSGLIGDLDSVTAGALDWAEKHAIIARHPADKDATDTELALAFAADMQPGRITLVGGGDRLDHTVAALGALGAPRLTNVPMLEAWWSGQHVDVLHGPDRCTLHLRPGSVLSAIALHGPIGGLTLDGVRWPLEAFDLHPVVGHGVSNEVLTELPAPTDDGAGERRRDRDRIVERAPGDVRVEISRGVLTLFDVPRYADDTTLRTPDPQDS